MRTQDEKASKPTWFAAPRTSAVAVSQELIRALVMKVSSDFAHSAFCPSSGVTADRASWRLRQRVQASVPLDAAKRWTLIAATELMFHLNRARPNDKLGLAVMRNQIGLRHPIARALDAQLLYMRQQSFRDGRPDAVAHIPWLTLSWKI